MSGIPPKMNAIVFNGPFDVETTLLDTPHIQHPDDVVVKVQYSGLCGTDLHTYRGHIDGPKKGVLGHEFTGKVVAKGDNVKALGIGDAVVACFTTQCGKCYYCVRGLSGVCEKTNTFGKTGLPGGQAEYVRVPNAENTVIKIVPNDPTYVLLADVFVTGYYGAKKIANYFAQDHVKGAVKTSPSDVTVLQVGAGPVGLCALRVLKHLGFSVVVVDSVASRLKTARAFGASKVINFEEDPRGIAEYVEKERNSIGFDAVLEAVGSKSSLKSAFDNVRKNGFVSCLGMTHGELPFEGLECYLKSLNISFGRCHAWALLPEAVEVFEELRGDFRDFVDYVARVEDSKEAFERFDKHEVKKVVFDFT